MLNRIPVYLLFSVAIVLSGCATTKGPKPIVSATGPTNTSYTTGVAKQFVDSADASFKNTSDAGLARAMMQNGFTLIYASCSDFFQSAGETQKWLIVVRDTVGAIGTLATGVMALHESGKNAIANVAFVTGATFAGLDIYTKNFLFAAENIESVRTLVTNALNTHRTAVEAVGAVTYQSATVALLDNQNICSPMQIAALARDAIKKGVVVASTDPASDLSAITQAQDQKALQTLGQILNPPGALTIDQAGALWWLLKDFSTNADKTNDIAPKLKDIPSTTSPFDNAGAYNAGWALADQVNNALNRFTDATKAAFKTTISTAKSAKAEAIAAQAAAKAGGPKAGLPPPIPPAPQFTGGTSIGAPTSTHISIGIR